MTSSSPSPRFRVVSREATSLLILSAASFSCVGAALVLPGTLLPVMVVRLGLDYREAGSLLAAQPLGHLTAVLGAPWVFRNASSGHLATFGFLPLATALGWLASATSLPAAATAMFLSGVGIGLIEVGTNAEILGDLQRANRMMNLAHLFFGIACVTIPPLATLSLEHGFPPGLSFVVAAAAALVGGMLWFTRRSQSNPSRGPASSATLPPRRLLFLALAMALYVGAEIGLGSWFTQYATQELGSSLWQAGWGLSLYWGGLTIGRLLLGLGAPAAPSTRLVTSLALASTVSSTAMLVSSEATLYVLFAALTGAAFSGIFPGILALAGRERGADPKGVTSLLLASAAGGQIVFPWAMGALAKELGLSVAMWLYPALCLGLFAAVTSYNRIVPSQQEPLNLV